MCGECARSAVVPTGVCGGLVRPAVLRRTLGLASAGPWQGVRRFFGGESLFSYYEN